MVKVSVIIPVYNSSCYLKQCLESVLRQTLSEIEVIVVDDGSTDDSFSILEKYRLADNRMKLIHFDKNTGVSHARNTGIGIAEGKYLYFLDSDDWIDDDYLDSMFLKAETTGQKVICNSSFVVEHECEGANIGHFWIKKGFEGFLNPSYVTSYSIPSLWVRLFRRDYIIHHKIFFPEELQGPEDILFTGLAELLQEWSFVFCGPLVHYRFRKDSLSRCGYDSFENIRASEILYCELKERNVSLRDVRLFRADQSLNIDSEDKFRFLRSFFLEIKSKVEEGKWLYLIAERILFKAIINSLDFSSFKSKYGINLGAIVFKLKAQLYDESLLAGIRDRLQDKLSRDLFDLRLNYSRYEDYDSYIEGLYPLVKDDFFEAYELNDKITKHGIQVIIYGTGMFGKWNFMSLKLAGMRVLCFIDDDPKVWGDDFCGLKVLPPSCLSVYPYDQAIILVCSNDREDVKKRLISQCINSDKIHISTINPNLVCANKRMQYFDVFSPLDYEIFIDAGSYDGQTVKDFEEWAKGKHTRVICLEPLPEMASNLRKEFGSNQNIEVHEVAAWESDSFMKFNNKESGSSISVNGSHVVRCSKIDDIAPVGVTFIKMDIEGAEIQALRGASETIRRDKPRLAISLYHKPEDIIDIPFLILRLVPDYKFWIRHYSTSGLETVLFASVSEELVSHEFQKWKISNHLIALHKQIIKSYDAIRPQLSVVIPVFNSGEWLSRCLDSLSGQTYRDFEIICVDDMSTDASTSIIHDKQKYDRRIVLLCSKIKVYDCGARQIGMDAARGEYVYFMDSDDYLDPDYLEAMVSQIKSSGSEYVINANYVKEWDNSDKKAFSTDFGFIKESQGYYASRTVQSLFPPVVWTRLWRRDYLVRNRIRWGDIPVASDVVFSGLGALLTDKAFVFRGPAYHYVQHEDSLMNQKGRGFLDIRSFSLLYDELTKRGFDLAGLRLFYLGPVLINNEDEFDLLKSFFTKIKDQINRESNLYVAHDLFVMDAVLKCDSFKAWETKFGHSTLNAFIRNDGLLSRVRNSLTKGNC